MAYGDAAVSGIQAIKTELNGVADVAGRAADAIAQTSRIAQESRSSFESTFAAGVKLKQQLNDIANSGTEYALFAAQVEGVVADVLSGTRSMQDALALVGDTLVQVDGKTQRLSSLFAATLPRVGEIQSALYEFLDTVEGMEDEVPAILDKLGQSASLAAQDISRIGDAILEGTANLDDLQRALDALRDAGGAGSDGDILGKRLADLLREAESDGLI